MEVVEESLNKEFISRPQLSTITDAGKSKQLWHRILVILPRFRLERSCIIWGLFSTLANAITEQL